MMNKASLPLLLGATLLGLAGADTSYPHRKPVQVAPPWCADTTDTAAQFMRTKLAMIVTGTDSLMTEARDSLSLPMAAASAIHLVADEQICERASRMLDSVFFIQGQEATVHVASVGERYAVRPPPSSTGGTTFAVITDTSFNILASTRW
jgi:uncharacterized membrane protein